MALVATAMSGCALKWWNWWSPRHFGVSWNMFTIALLWRFKPEDRCILPIVDDEEEPDQELYPLVEQSGKSHESLNAVIEAWDRFLLSTEDVDVPPMNVVNGGNVDLPTATTNELIEKPKSLDDSLLIDDCLPPHHLARFDGFDSLEALHLDTKFHFPIFSQQLSSTFTPKTAISFNVTLLRNDTLRDELFAAPFIGSSSAKMIVMLPLHFISLFDPGGTQLVTTSPLWFSTEVVLNLVPLPWFHNFHVLLAQVPCYTAMSLINDDGVFEFEISESTKHSLRITLCDTHCVFGEMTLSGTCYFSTNNCSLDFKQWDPGTIKAPHSGFPITNLRFILLEDNTIDRNGQWLHESYVECCHRSSGKNYCLVSPWTCDEWLLLDHFSAHKPHSRLLPTGLVHHMTYKPLSNLIFLELKVSSFMVDLNHMFVHFFARWIHITPTLRVASTQTKMLKTFSSYCLAMAYTFYVTPILIESCDWDHYVIMIANVSEIGYLKLIIVLNGMPFLYGYGEAKLVASGSNGSFYLETYHYFSMVKLHILTMIDDATAYEIEHVTDRGSDFFEAYDDPFYGSPIVASFYSFEMNPELPLMYYISDFRSMGTTPSALTNCVFHSATKMDPAIMKELHIYIMLFLIGFGTRLYSGQAYTHVPEIANSSYTSNVTYVLVYLHWYIGLAPGCTFSTTLYARDKGIVCGFILNFIVPVHCLISIGLLAQFKFDRVAKNDMVEFVLQGRVKFPKLEVVATQEYVVVICLNDTQLLSTILYSCLATQYEAIKIIERLDLLIQVHSSIYLCQAFFVVQ